MAENKSEIINEGEQAAKILMLEQLVEQLRRERDEARREICESTAESADLYPREFAKKMGWDCYAENTNG